jgi:putative ABC transport system permease protein
MHLNNVEKYLFRKPANYHTMVKHLFKLIWNKKKQNFLLFSEMLVSFLVLFAVFTLLVYYYHNYKKPMGMDYQPVWAVNYSNAYQSNNADSMSLYYETLRKTVLSYKGVEGMSFMSDNVPFSQSSNGAGLYYKSMRKQVELFTVEDGYQQVLGMKILEGRWFERQDGISRSKAVVINETLREQFFHGENAVGKLLGFDHDDKNPMKVIGVVQDVKVKGDYSKVKQAAYVRVDTASFRSLGNILVKVRPDADAAFEGRLYKIFSNSMKNSNIEIEHLSSKLVSTNYFNLVPMIVASIVSGFLIINVALGLFGVLWYNINRRRGEIGLRRAVGASGMSVSVQLIAESMVLATLSLGVGIFFAVQFPILNVFDLPAGVYITAILFSILSIYLLVGLCSLYPGRQAASIYPAVALHED